MPTNPLFTVQPVRAMAVSKTHDAGTLEARVAVVLTVVRSQEIYDRPKLSVTHVAEMPERATRPQGPRGARAKSFINAAGAAENHLRLARVEMHRKPPLDT